MQQVERFGKSEFRFPNLTGLFNTLFTDSNHGWRADFN